jgi:hypothetical protein
MASGSAYRPASGSERVLGELVLNKVRERKNGKGKS